MKRLQTHRSMLGMIPGLHTVRIQTYPYFVESVTMIIPGCLEGIKGIQISDGFDSIILNLSMMDMLAMYSANLIGMTADPVQCSITLPVHLTLRGNELSIRIDSSISRRDQTMLVVVSYTEVSHGE